MKRRGFSIFMVNQLYPINHLFVFTFETVRAK